MKKDCLYGLMFLLAALSASCGDNDDYHYPSVRLEFLTAYSGADGTLQSVQTDDGARYTVLADDSDTRINADSLVRIICNYGLEPASDGGKGVHLYALSKAISPLPIPADSFKDGVKTKPADVTSIWLGYGYLNMVLSVKQQKVHTLGFVEDEVTVGDGGCATVRLTLFHDTTSDVEDYSKRAYVSVPLRQYLDNEDVHSLRVYFSVHTTGSDEGVKTYEFEVDDFT